MYSFEDVCQKCGWFTATSVVWDMESNTKSYRDWGKEVHASLNNLVCFGRAVCSSGNLGSEWWRGGQTWLGSGSSIREAPGDDVSHWCERAWIPLKGLLVWPPLVIPEGKLVGRKWVLPSVGAEVWKGPSRPARLASCCHRNPFKGRMDVFWLTFPFS